MKYLAVLGRQPEISIAELEAQFGVSGLSPAGFVVAFSPNATKAPLGVPQVMPPVGANIDAGVDTNAKVDINRFGGVLKFAVEIEGAPLEYLKNVEDGKITLGVSDYSRGATRKTAAMEALKLKKILVRHGRKVRVVENKEAVLSSATSLHNGLSGKNPRKIEFIKTNDGWYRVIGVQDVGAYARRDQARPARDARVGMLPPKLAQVLINLCGPLKPGATVLDPFCGTGVLLQEAILMGYSVYGTDLSERMVEYTKKNLAWLAARLRGTEMSQKLEVGDATKFEWGRPIDAVACEGYLGRPMSQIPSEMKLKTEKQECGATILGFLRNLVGQIRPGTPVVIAVPAWLRENGEYSRLEILDEIDKMGYNVSNKSCEGLIYRREGQIVARDIIILRKK